MSEATAVVSIVLPTYNRLAYLRQAVESVRAQTLQDWELIVVDDGSTDGSADEIDSMGDARVRVVRSSHIGNVSAVRNAGIAQARGEYVAFLDSDDLWEPRKLELQLRGLRRGGCRWGYTGIDTVDEEGRSIPFRAGEFHPHSGHILPLLLAMETTVATQSLLVERSLMQAVGGFDESLTGSEETDLNLRLAAVAAVDVLPETLTKVREHPGRTSHQVANSSADKLRVYVKFLQREQDPHLRRLAENQCAKILLEGSAAEARAGSRLSALRMLIRALAFRPSFAGFSRALARMVRYSARGGSGR